MRMSFHVSWLKSRTNAKKLSEYLFSLPNPPSKPGTVTRRHRAELQLKRRRRRIVLVAFRERRSLPPPWSGDDVLDAVVVQIAGGGALAPELVVQLDPRERCSAAEVRFEPAAPTSERATSAYVARLEL